MKTYDLTMMEIEKKGTGRHNRSNGGVQSDGPYGQKVSRTVFLTSSSLVEGQKPGGLRKLLVAMMILARHRPIFGAMAGPILRASDSVKGCWREQRDT